MVYTVYQQTCLKQKLPHAPVSAVAGVANKMFLGTEDGSLLVYQIATTLDRATGQKRYQMLPQDCRPGFAEQGGQRAKPITQMVPIPELDLLLSLVDGTIMQHRLSNLEFKSVIRGIKSCNVYSVKKDSQRFHMAAGGKKKLYLLDYRDSADGEFTLQKELPLPDNVKTLCWAGPQVCLGFKKEYTLLDATTPTGSMVELFTPGRSQVPLGCTMEITSELMLARENTGISIGYDGKPSKKFGTPWLDIPHAIFSAHPYVLSIHPQFVEVRNPSQTESLCQQIVLKNVRYLSLSSFSDLDAATTVRSPRGRSPPHSPGDVLDKGGGEGDRGSQRMLLQMIFVATKDNGVFLFDPVSYSDQVAELSRMHAYEEALALCDKFPHDAVPEEQILTVHLLFGYWHFKEGHYKDAMHQFIQSKCDPRMVIKLFPNLLPEYVDKLWRPPQNDDVEQALRAAQAAIGGEQEARKALSSARFFLKGCRTKSRLPEVEDKREDDASEEGMRLASVDTALFIALFKTQTDGDTGPDSALSFLREPNRCVLKDCEKTLEREGGWAELVELYRSKGLHREALERLQELGGAASAGKRGDFDAVTATVRYCQDLDSTNHKLILDFSNWVLDVAADESSPTTMDSVLQMFCHHRPSTIIPPRIAYDHLRNAPREKNYALHTRYLELILDDPEHSKREDCINEELHEDRIYAYLNLMKELRRQDEAAGAALVSKKLQLWLRRSTKYDPEKMVSHFRAGACYSRDPERELGSEYAILLSRLEQHDRALNVLVHKLGAVGEAEEYCKSEHRRRVPDGWAQLAPGPAGTRPGYVCLASFRVQQPRRDGLRSAAATQETHAYERAEEDSRRVRVLRSGEVVTLAPPQSQQRHELYFILLRVMLQPLDGLPDTPKVKEALHVLSRYQDEIDPIRALQLLPGDIPVKEIAPWLTLTLKTSSILEKETMVHASLSKAEQLGVDVDCARLKHDSVTIHPDQKCGVCQRKIGTAVFACYPNKICVHFRCMSKGEQGKSICPVTKRQFNRVDNLFSA